jgi:hypothetical protein
VFAGEMLSGGINARLNNPTGLTVDSSSGALLICNTGNFALEMVSSVNDTDTFSRVAGSGQFGNADDVALSAMFGGLSDVAVDFGGNIFMTDSVWSNIRKLSTSGFVSTFVGSAFGYADGVGTNALLFAPQGLAVNSGGGLYVVDGTRIREVSAVGVVTTLAGSSDMENADGVGSSASFSSPFGVCTNAAGILFVTTLHRIVRVTPTGGVSSIAGSDSIGFADGPGLDALFTTPLGITVDSVGNVFVADHLNAAVRKLSSLQCPVGQVLESMRCTYVNAGYYSPGGGVAYVCPAGHYSSFGAGNCTVCGAGYFSDYGASSCTGCPANTYSTVLGAINVNSCEACPAGLYATVGSTACNGCRPGFFFSGGACVLAPVGFYSPSFGSWAPQLCLLSTLVGAVNCEHLESFDVSTFVGSRVSSGASSSVDGWGSEARFSSPFGIAVDHFGSFFVTEAGGIGSRVRKISSAGMCRH